MSINPMVQVGQADSGGSLVTTLTITVANPVVQGNLLVAAVTAGNQSVVFTPPTGWTQAVYNAAQGSAQLAAGIWYLVVGAADAGKTGWTWTLNASHSCLGSIEEWSASNGWPSNPLDVTAQGNTNASPSPGTTISSGTTATTGQAEELWIANLAYKGGVQALSSITAGWTSDNNFATGTSTAMSQLHQIVSSTSAASVSATISVAEYWAGAVATFKDTIASGVALAGESDGKSTATSALVGAGLQGQADGVATANAALAPTPSKVTTPSRSPIVAKYTVRLRDPNLTTVDQIAQFERLAYVRRFNGAGDWAIEVDANDPAAALLVKEGYGISVTRSVYSVLTGKLISSRVEIAGPMTGISREMSNNLLQVHGKDDNVWLQRRQAWPTTSGNNFSADVLSTSPLLYWRMDATSGTTQTDASGNGNTGTYGSAGGGSYALNQTSLIDDPNPCVAFTSSDLSSARGYCYKSAGTASVTGSFTVFLVASSGTLGGICGSRNLTGGFDNSFDIQIPSGFSGFIHGDIGDGTAWGTTVANGNPTTVVPTAGAYVICYVVTGTDWTVYLNGQVVGSGMYASAITPMLWDANHPFYVGTSGNSTTQTNTACNGSLDEVIVWNNALPAATVQWLSAEAISKLAHQAYDSQSGPAETVIKHYVSANLGSAAYTERQLSNFTVATDQTRGSTVAGNARFDQLILADGTGLLQQLALAGGVGFQISTLNGQMTFDVYVPNDRTNTVYFSQALGNLLDFKYTRDAPSSQETGGNAFIVGGSGQGNGRLFETELDSVSIGLWGRAEQFVDARDTADIATMIQRGQAALSASAEVDTFSATLTSAPQTVYGVDFDLGDKVSAVIDGVVFQELIREVDVTLEGGKAESIVPVMGTPDAVAVRDAILRHLRKIQKSVAVLRNLQTRL